MTAAEDRDTLREQVARALAGPCLCRGGMVDSLYGPYDCHACDDDGYLSRTEKHYADADALLPLLAAERAAGRAEALRDAEQAVRALEPYKAALAGGHAWGDAADVIAGLRAPDGPAEVRCTHGPMCQWCSTAPKRAPDGPASSGEPTWSGLMA